MNQQQLLILDLDDSPEKAEQHYGNLLPITPFTGDPTDTELRAILPYLDWIRTVENTRIIEKRYWRAWVPPTPQPPKRGLDR
jgi:TFIIF-interacting CTD phosphatase-like protein